MLSLEKCKQILNRSEMDDESVEILRDGLYLITNMTFNNWLKESEARKRQDSSLPKSSSEDTSGLK